MSWVCLGTSFLREASSPDAEPRHLAPLSVEEQWLYSKSLPDDSASHTFSEGESSNLAFTVSFFGSLPTIDDLGRRQGWHLTEYALLQLPHGCVCQTPSLCFPHSWTWTWYTSLLTPRRISNFICWCWFSSPLLHTWLRNAHESWRSSLRNVM